MSWFSRSFSINERKDIVSGDEEDDEEEEEDEEEDEERANQMNLAALASATGTSVKEDLSNLTKTFTRQLWGVASFLAPSPAEKFSPAESRQSEVILAAGQMVGKQSNDPDGRSPRGEVEMESQSWQGFKANRIRPELNLSSNKGESGDTLPKETDAQSIVSSSSVPIEENVLPSTGQVFGRPRLTGLRSDLAELRGTMATGFSRLSSSVIRVVAGEDGSGGEEEDFSAVSPRGTHPPPIPKELDDDQQFNSPGHGLDVFLRPLFGKILTRESSDVYVDEDVGTNKEPYVRKYRGEGESRSSDMELLPSAIASGIDGISKLASSLLQIVRDEGDEETEVEDSGVVGVTEAVVTFARNIAMHPETWLDFPLTDEGTDDDFVLTNTQKEHAHALEIAVPSLRALRIELCPNYMTAERFWKIYFVLTHSRFSSDEARMLSTEQIVRTRTSMLQALQKREPQIDEVGSIAKVEVEIPEAFQQESKKEELEGCSVVLVTSSAALTDITVASAYPQEKQVGEADQSANYNKEAEEMKSGPAKERCSMSKVEDESEVDEWLDEEHSMGQHEVGGDSNQVNMSNIDEDVSFSDLEEEDASQTASCIKETIMHSDPGSSSSKPLASEIITPLEAVSGPLRHESGTPSKSSERGEFNDWLTVDQDDVASDGSSP